MLVGQADCIWSRRFGRPVIRPIRSEAEARSDDAPSFGFLYMYKREIGYSSVCFFGKVIRISVPFPTSL